MFIKCDRRNKAELVLGGCHDTDLPLQIGNGNPEENHHWLLFEVPWSTTPAQVYVDDDDRLRMIDGGAECGRALHRKAITHGN